MRTSTLAIFLICLVATLVRSVRGQDVQIELPDAPIEFGTVEVDGDNFRVASLSTRLESIEESYTVSVPYQETVGNQTVTRVRQETRTRTRNAPQLLKEVLSIPPDAIRFSSLSSGEPIDNLSLVRKALRKPRLAVVTYAPEPLANYYRQLLNPSVVVLHIDREKLTSLPPVEPIAPISAEPFRAAAVPAASLSGKPIRDFLVGEPVECGQIVFRPETWKAKGESTRLYPWEGNEIVFLTTSADFDPELMQNWVLKLDQGWNLYAELTGERPKLFKQLDGKATIVAVPGYEFTCGAGCGYLGVTGVELAMFYSHNYPTLKKRPAAIPHYVFYEMGRNYFTFGDRHSCFTTGFAVFMRYVCMDALKCEDIEPQLRSTIERVEQGIATSEMDFLEVFTNVRSTGEKGNRIRDGRGELIIPSDQPVTYASAMLRLRREYGGDQWVKRFFHTLKEAPTAPDKTEDGAMRQCYAWLVCASLAAEQDLSPIFCDEWRMPLSPRQRNVLKQTKWDSPDRSVARIVEQLVAAR